MENNRRRQEYRAENGKGAAQMDGVQRDRGSDQRKKPIDQIQPPDDPGRQAGITPCHDADADRDCDQDQAGREEPGLQGREKVFARNGGGGAPLMTFIKASSAGFSFPRIIQRSSCCAR